MSRINLHFNGNVNITLNLPLDRMGPDHPDENYRMLVNGLESYLHDYEDEEYTPPEDLDSIVMVMRPGEAPDIMLESESIETVESRGIYDCVELLTDHSLAVPGLLAAFDGRRVLTMDHERYLLGPVIVYSCDDEGDSVSLSAEDVIAAVVYFANHTVTLWADGKDLPAYRIGTTGK